MKIKEVKNIRRYKAGYEVRTVIIDGEEYGGDDVELKSAYTPEGYYIGNSVWAYRLCKTRGIKPEIKSSLVNRDPSEFNGGAGPTCSIGFCKSEQRWYGWSHRAISGFGVGSVVDSLDHVCATSGYTDEFLADNPEYDNSLPLGFEAKNIDDAKRMAIAFADSVA